jgi:hypothetical protein
VRDQIIKAYLQILRRRRAIEFISVFESPVRRARVWCASKVSQKVHKLRPRLARRHTSRAPRFEIGVDHRFGVGVVVDVIFTFGCARKF